MKEHFNFKDRTGEKFITNEGYEVEIIEYKGAKDCAVLFENGIILHNKCYEKIKEGKSKGEEFIYEDLYYYPNVNSCLKAYLNKSLEESTDVKHCIQLIQDTYNKIAKLA